MEQSGGRWLHSTLIGRDDEDAEEAGRLPSAESCVAPVDAFGPVDVVGVGQQAPVLVPRPDVPFQRVVLGRENLPSD